MLCQLWIRSSNHIELMIQLIFEPCRSVFFSRNPRTHALFLRRLICEVRAQVGNKYSAEGHRPAFTLTFNKPVCLLSLNFCPGCLAAAYKKTTWHLPHCGIKDFFILFADKQQMDITKKNISLIVVLGILLYGLPVVTLCSFSCASSNHDLDSPVERICPIIYHSFIQISVVLSALFVLLPAGFFPTPGRQFIPSGVYWPLFRPPRFSS